MRALFTFAGGSGHFLPTVPFSRVLRERGHEIMYACQEGMVPAVVSAGWAAVASGGNTLLDPQERRPLAAVDRVAEESAIRRSFAGKIARERTDRLLEIAAKRRPDLVVRDEVDFAGAIAADVLGLPHAAVVVIAAGGLLRADVVEEPLAALLANHGVLVFHRTPELAIMIGGVVEEAAQAGINAHRLGGPVEIPNDLRAAALQRAMTFEQQGTSTA